MSIKVSLCGAGMTALALPALAQTPPEQVAASQVEVVVVTAQKREQNQQDVPISMTALSEEALLRSGVSSLDSIQRYAPGLTMSTVGSGFVSYTYIRGSGTNQLDSGSDPSVAFFVDEVYVSGTAGLQFDLFDVERVEVLKGPQGTLFGRNAAAGAISITTRRPSSNFGGSVSADIGDYGAYTGRGTVTGPITEDGRMRVRVSGTVRGRDAFTKNLSGGKDPGDIDTAAARAQFEFAGDNVDVLISADGYRARNGMTNQFLASSAKTAFISPADLALLPPGESFYRHYYDVDGHEDQDTHGLTARVEASTPLGDLTSISAYRSNEFDRVQDQDGTVLAAYRLDSHQEDSSFSQELRLSDAWERMSWVAGLYYYDSTTRRQDQVIAGPNFATVAFRNTVSTDRSEIETRSYGLFAQLTYGLTDALNLTVGGRYTRDEKENERYVSRFTFAPYTVDPSRDWSSFDPAVTLDYEISPAIMTYVSYRHGFKSGGFQTLLPVSAALAATTFEPEQVRSYEVGLKSEWFDHRLRANVAAFRADVKEQQILRTVLVPGNPSNNIIDNAGSTRTDGVDVAITLQPTTTLRFDTSMTFQHARFQEYMSGTSSFAGNSQLRSPDFTGYYGAEYTFTLGGAGKLRARGEYVYQSEVFFDVANTKLPGVYQPGYGLTNARLTYEPASSDWELALWARNIGDKEYFRNIAVSGVTGLAAPGDPRTVGVSAQYNF